MIGSFITRGLAMVFGYAYPAYECYKTIEKNKPEIEQLRFWCQYWILVAVWTVCERFSDAFVSWVPMYSEAKLAFFIYLWYPKTKGTTYVYDSFFRPLIAKHETEIDRSLLELKTRAGDIAVLYWQKAASYGQTRVFEILQYFASQSTPRPCPPVQRQPPLNQKLVAATQPPPLNQKLVAATESHAVEPLSPTPSVSSKDSEGVEELAAAHPQTPRANPPKPETITQKNPFTQTSPGPAIQAPPTVAANELKAIALQSTTEKMALRSSPSSPAAAAAMSSGLENANPPPQETLMEEAVRVTRGRLRRARSAAAPR